MQQVPRKGCALDQQQGIFQDPNMATSEEVTTEPCHAQTGGAVQSMLSIHSNMTLNISIPEQINPTTSVVHHHDPPHFLCVHPLHKTHFFRVAAGLAPTSLWEARRSVKRSTMAALTSQGVVGMSAVPGYQILCSQMSRKSSIKGSIKLLNCSCVDSQGPSKIVTKYMFSGLYRSEGGRFMQTKATTPRLATSPAILFPKGLYQSTPILNTSHNPSFAAWNCCWRIFVMTNIQGNLE